MITKENYNTYINYKKIERDISEKIQSFMKKIDIEWKSISLDIILQCQITLSYDEKIVISFVCENVSKEYECSTEILFDEPSEIIQLRNIKDVLYQIKKEIKPKKSFWRFLR